MEKITPGKHVSLVYDLYAVNADGSETLMHQSDPQDPEQIIFGVTQGVIAPLEKAIEGLVKGDKFNVIAKADEAFGPHNPDMIVTLDKDMFVVDGKFDTDVVAVGKYVPMLTAEGYRVSGLVTEIGKDKVTLDFNHPLAGKDVRFDGSILEVRDATDEELHIASGAGCGCQGGCGSNGCGSNEGEGGGCCGNCGCN